MRLAAAVERPFGAAGWRRAALAGMAGVIATFGLAPYDFPLAGFIAFPMLVLALDGLVRRQERAGAAFRLGWCFGFGYFVGGLWWLGAAMLVDAAAFWWALPLAVLGLPAVLAIYYGLAVAAAWRFWPEGQGAGAGAGAGRIVILALAFALAEYARARLFTGFPWNEIGLLAAPNDLFMQSAALWGPHGLTLVAVIIFSAPVLFLRPQRMRGGVLGMAALLLAVHAGTGMVRLSGNALYGAPAAVAPDTEDGALAVDPEDGALAPVVRIIQPNIDQSRKWDPAQADAILRLLMDMTAAERSPGRASVVVWPESSLPYLISDASPVVRAVAASLAPQERLLAGAARVQDMPGREPAYYNSILAVRPDGVVDSRFDKVHLVPFGEYLPFQGLLERLGIMQLTQLPGGFSAAATRQTGQVSGVPGFLPLICYEIIFPSEVVRTPDDTFILNVTNDAWYGATPGPYQHLKHARLTAVALGLPLVRAANSGISVITDSMGRDVASLGLGERGVVAASLPPPAAPTLFARHGNLIFWLMAAAALAAIPATRPFSRR